LRLAGPHARNRSAGDCDAFRCCGRTPEVPRYFRESRSCTSYRNRGADYWDRQSQVCIARYPTVSLKPIGLGPDSSPDALETAALRSIFKTPIRPSKPPSRDRFLSGNRWRLCFGAGSWPSSAFVQGDQSVYYRRQSVRSTDFAAGASSSAVIHEIEPARLNRLASALYAAYDELGFTRGAAEPSGVSRTVSCSAGQGIEPRDWEFDKAHPKSLNFC
jgi:hypothetical protein